MKRILGRSSAAPRHPLLDAYARANRRRATGADLEAFFRGLWATPLHLATHRSEEGLDAADVMVLESASSDWTALPAYLDPPERLLTLGQIGGWVAALGSDACRVARVRQCNELAVFADSERDPDLVVGWDAIDWLGAGLVPFYERNAGDHTTLLDQALEDASRAAVEPHDEIEMAQLTEGVPLEGDDRRPVILASVPGSIAPGTWFHIRTRIETELSEAGHNITVVTEPDAVILETHMDFNEWSSTADDASIFIK